MEERHEKATRIGNKAGKSVCECYAPNGFSAGDIRALFFRCQMVAYLESEIRLLKAELERRNLDIDEL